MMKNDEITKKFLAPLFSSHFIKSSYQRISILKYLIEKKNHHFGEMEYKSLGIKIPTLSKTMIYSNLNLFCEHHLGNTQIIDEIETKYDYIETTLAHFMCKQCHKILDIELQTDIFGLNQINEYQIYES